MVREKHVAVFAKVGNDVREFIIKKKMGKLSECHHETQLSIHGPHQ
jgi:hypothetical protein